MLDEARLLLPPLAAGCLVLLSHLPLGQQVLKRGILFIDLAVAQLAALGGLLAHWIGDHSDVAVQAGGAILAVSGAVVIGYLARTFPDQREALIGLIYSGAAALLLILIAADPHGHQHLTRSLSGDVLWVEYGDLWPLAGLTTVFLIGRFRKRSWVEGALFYPLFALLVSLSVPLLGIYLVFATLIAPALVAQTVRSSAGWIVGILGYLLGLTLAWQYDWPTGATLVLTLLALGCGVLVCMHLMQWAKAGSRLPYESKPDGASET